MRRGHPLAGPGPAGRLRVVGVDVMTSGSADRATGRPVMAPEAAPAQDAVAPVGPAAPEAAPVQDDVVVVGPVGPVGPTRREPPQAAKGLSSTEVAERVAAGQVNVAGASTGRTLGQILRANLLTRFNAILGTLFVVILIFGPIQDGLFGIVLVVNSGVGIVQEVRAKRALDRLAVLTAPVARARRDGTLRDVPVAEVVLDDVIELRAGDQVVADGLVVVGAGLEVDESLLSGESLPVTKRADDEVWSGSIVVGGHGAMCVTRVGADALAQRIQGEGRRFGLMRSELADGNNRILRLVTWVMVPVGLLLVVSQIVRSGQALGNAVRGTVAGVGAMVPEGLVLLTTIAFAVGAIRLARHRALAQELAAVEGLARVDVLCIDKTGTLTDPGMNLSDVVAFGDAPARDALGAMAWSDPAPNATMLAIQVLPRPDGWVPERSVVFSSARKWSAMQFRDRGTWVLGAPELLTPDLGAPWAAELAAHVARGRRVVELARSASPLTGDALPAPLECVALVVFEERLRPDADRTIGYLQAQGVAVKVLSGDRPDTVAAVARRVGIEGASSALDARTLPDDPEALAAVVEQVSVLGRVQPSQKRDIVLALQSNGHVVAMTGDGVNDIPALKAADIGMAMGSGSAATRAVGRIVLLENSFAVVPQVLIEGRKVIANVQRVARLFVNKTVYAALLALVVGVTAVPYPFYPRHLTLVSSLTIGIPGFFLALAPSAPRARIGFLPRVLSFAVPSGSVAALATLTTYLLAREVGGTSGAAARTAATGCLLVLGYVVLALVARPLTPARAALVVAMAAGAVLVGVFPLGRTIFGLAMPSLTALAWAALVTGAAVVALPVTVAAGERYARRRGLWGSKPATTTHR